VRDYGSVDKHHLTFERHFTVPPERIWSALTDAGELERWLGVAELELKVGGNLVVRFAHVKGAEMHGVFTRVEPPHLLEHTWRESGAESLVRWEIERDEEGHTNLTFTQSIDREPDSLGLAAGWHLHLDLLAASLERNEFAWDDARYQAIRRDYERRSADVRDVQEIS
jgi:uncharacterized protein YndB with AHSA1/START domain